MSENIKNIEKSFAMFEVNPSDEKREAMVENINGYIASISDIVGDKTYVIEGITLAQYCLNVQNKVDAYANAKGGMTKTNINEVMSDINKIVDV